MCHICRTVDLFLEGCPTCRTVDAFRRSCLWRAEGKVQQVTALFLLT